MNSNKLSNVFPSGTIIVAYKGKTLGGTADVPHWVIEPILNEKRYYRSKDGLLSTLTVNNSISLEFEAVNPQQLAPENNLYSTEEVDSSPGELTFLPLDPEKEVAYFFPSAELKTKEELPDKKSVIWKFEILSDNNGIFMEKFKTNT